jgi:hypothetical protein
VTGGPPDDPNDRYRPDPRKPSPVWQAIKWPIRKLLLGVYYLIQAARRHKAVALVVSILLIGLIAAGVTIRQLTLPPQQAGHTIPTSVTHYFHGRETYNAQEVWNSFDPSLRANVGSVQQLQTVLDQDKAQGNTYTSYSYETSYQAADGGSIYVFQVYGASSGQPGSATLAVIVGSSGLITGITPV